MYKICHALKQRPGTPIAGMFGSIDAPARHLVVEIGTVARRPGEHPAVTGDGERIAIEQPTDLVARRLRSGGFGITRQPRYPLAENTAATAAMRAIVPTAHIEPGGRQRRPVTERLEQIVFGHRLDDRHRHLALGERGAVEQGDLIVIELAERAYSAGVQIGIVTGLGSRCEGAGPCRRSEEHTSELQSLMRISSADFCLKKKQQKIMN